MDLLKALNWRYAVKKLLPDKMVPQEKIDRILEAARLAPSADNVQPWQFVVVSDKDFQQQLEEACYGQEKVGEASHVVVIMARTNWDEAYAEQLAKLEAKERDLSSEEFKARKDRLTSIVQSKSGDALFAWSKQQAFIALGFLLAAAATEEVDAGPMAGFNRQKVDEVLGLANSSYSTVAVVALGYRDQADKYAHWPKVRRSKKDVVIEPKL